MSLKARMHNPQIWQFRQNLRQVAAKLLPAERRDEFVRRMNGPTAEHLPPLLRALGSRLWCRYREIKPLTQSLEGQKVCLFAHFDRDGLIEEYVTYHLSHLQQTGALIIFVTTGPSLSTAEIKKLDPFCIAIVERENLGRDFGSWRTALLMYPQIWQCQTLFFANDSVYGPLHNLHLIMDKMAIAGCDFWGITESRQIKTHYQSYFLAFYKSCLLSRGFLDECNAMALLNDRDELIYINEVGMKGRLNAHGLRGTALLPVLPQLKLTENPTLHYWREILAAGAPYLKVQLLRENPHRQPIADWPAVVGSYGYDPSLIERHLRRTS